MGAEKTWELGAGATIFVEKPDGDLHQVEVADQYRVVIGGGVRRRGERRVGRGRILIVDGEDSSFVSGDTFVCAGLEAEFPFGQRGKITVAPHLENENRG